MSANSTKQSKPGKKRLSFGLTTKSVGRAFLYSTTAPATSRKLKPRGRKRKFFPGAEKLPEHRPAACVASGQVVRLRSSSELQPRRARRPYVPRVLRAP